MTSGLRKSFMGKRIILNMFRKHGYSVSPGINDRARAVGRCAREAPNKEARMKCFATGGK